MLDEEATGHSEEEGAELGDAAPDAEAAGEVEADEPEAESAAEAPEPTGEGGDEEQKTGDPDKFSGGGDIAVGDAGSESGLAPGEAEKAGDVPTQFRVPPGVPGGLDPGKTDRDIRPRT
jgi:hypothetical protein